MFETKNKCVFYYNDYLISNICVFIRIKFVVNDVKSTHSIITSFNKFLNEISVSRYTVCVSYRF